MLDGSMSHLGADRPCEHSSLLGGAVFAWTAAALACATSIASAQSFTPFTSEHAARGVIYNMMFTPPLDNPQDGFGMAAADLDGDGDLDLVLLGRADGLVGLYENNGVGIFTNRSATSAIAATAAGAGVSAFDYDSDGDLDLYLAQKNRASKLWRNDGALSFTDVTRAAGLELTAPVTGTSVADYDGDGWLDLAVCVYSASQANKLYRNQGDGTFAEVGAALGVASLGLSYASVWSDYNRDTWPDLCVSNDRGVSGVPNQLWRNDAGVFSDVSARSGMQVSLCSMGVACADLTGDGRSDYYFTNLPDRSPPLLGVNPLLVSSVGNTFTQAQALWGVENRRMSWGACFWDVDNDADLDLYVNNEFQPNALFQNSGTPPMSEIGAAAAVAGTANLSFASAIGDLDGDGDLDLVVNNLGGAVRLYMNQEGQSRNWLRLRVAGSGSVRDAIGACATVQPADASGDVGPTQWREVLCGGNGYLAQHETTLHFGLDGATRASTVEVQWPALGGTRLLSNLASNIVWTAYPPSRLGDVDGNGTVDLIDWAQFTSWGTGPLLPGREMLDGDGDADLDASDVDAFWSRCSLTRGDLDGNGSVRADDLAFLLVAWGESGVTADLDLDGAVGASDLALLLSSWTP